MFNRSVPLKANNGVITYFYLWFSNNRKQYIINLRNAERTKHIKAKQLFNFNNKRQPLSKLFSTVKFIILYIIGPLLDEYSPRELFLSCYLRPSKTVYIRLVVLDCIKQKGQGNEVIRLYSFMYVVVVVLMTWP